MSPRAAVVAVFGTLIAILVALTWVMSAIVASQREVAATEERRYASSRLADELRQSSSDLTRMARTYVVTGDPIYEQYFRDILAIRNGEMPRPASYGGAYWDLVVDQRERPTPDGPPISLEQLMLDMGFTTAEFGLLKDAQNKSDSLVHLERVAMNAIEGRFDDGTGRFAIQREPDPEMARSIMHGPEYHAAKARIMEPITAFLSMVDERTANELATLRATERRYTWIALTLLGVGLLLVAAIGAFVYARVIGRLERRYETVRQLGRYQVLEKIGEGGMGKVYRAQHALLRRPTAVKLLDAEGASEEAAARFEREVQAAASLTHPNTIEIYDYGATPDGGFYYAMEYLDGINLSELVQEEGPLPEARVLHILRQAAGSLAEAHARRMIHRDLKPSNIMLCRRGDTFDFVKVVDFGLVRPRDTDLNLTSTESLTGTPLFLSPEALESPEKVDTFSDVYQLGAVGYYLLTGRYVLSGENLIEVMTSLLHETPQPPSTVLGHALSPELEQLVLSCLEKDPAQRPANASVLLDALEQCSVSGSWTQRDARAWWDASADLRARVHSASSDTNRLPSGWQIDLEDR